MALKIFFQMDAGEAAEITTLLKAWSAGDAAAQSSSESNMMAVFRPSYDA